LLIVCRTLGSRSPSEKNQGQDLNTIVNQSDYQGYVQGQTGRQCWTTAVRSVAMRCGKIEGRYIWTHCTDRSSYCRGRAQGQTQGEDCVSGRDRSVVLASLVGDEARSAGSAAAASSSTSSSVFESDLSVDSVAVRAKQARLELDPCGTPPDWQPLD